MSQLKSSLSPRRLTVAAVIVLMILHVASHIPDWVSNAERNITLTQELISGDWSEAPIHDPPPYGCQDYLPTIAMLVREQLAPDQYLAQAQRWSSCWPDDRRRLLNVRLFDSMAALGQWDELCRGLSAVHAVDKLLLLAEEAEAGGHWQDMSNFLQCLEQSDWGEAWVSPWRVAVLYQHLGQYLESQQAFPQAIAAYQKAAAWHPGVWAMPYLQGASLLWRQNRQSEALSFLIVALNKAPDDTAAFDLWYQLAEYWAAQGDENDSLCAYRQAAQLLDRLPAPPGIDLAKLQRSVEAASALPAEQCFQSFPMVHPR